MPTIPTKTQATMLSSETVDYGNLVQYNTANKQPPYFKDFLTIG